MESLYITTPELLAIRYTNVRYTPKQIVVQEHTGHSSAASFPTGPVIAEPFISPFGLTICDIQSISHNPSIPQPKPPTELDTIPSKPISSCSCNLPKRAKHKTRITLTTPALSSKYKNTPSGLLHGLLCLTTTAGMTFFLSSGFPFLTVAMTMSPTPAAGSRFRRAPMPLTEMM